MITWMQRHKKYLVITIWISTVAFVGAGFVGWGAYDMNNNRAKSVAKVGHRNISIQEFSQTYNEIYAYYLSALGGNFSQERAEEMGLDGVVLDRLLQNAIFLNYADDIGLIANDSDLIAALLADPNFQKDGKFDKSQYESVLKRARISSKDYENSLRDKILLQKLFAALNLGTNEADLKMINSAYFMQDKINIKIIETPQKSEIDSNETALMEFWEKNKNSYQTKKEYLLETKFIGVEKMDANESVLREFFEENRGDYRNSDDTLLSFEEANESVVRDFALKNTRKTALEEYLKIKKDKTELTQKISVSDENATNFPLNEIAALQIGDALKPFEYKDENLGDGFLIVRLNSVKEPREMSFDEAKNSLKIAFESAKIAEILATKAKGELENFSGNEVGFFTRDENIKIPGLSESESSEFVGRLFNAKSKKGYEIIGQKAVVYEIMEQDLLNEPKFEEYSTLLAQNANNLKNAELQSDLLKALQKRYKIELYYKR